MPKSKIFPYIGQYLKEEFNNHNYPPNENMWPTAEPHIFYRDVSCDHQSIIFLQLAPPPPAPHIFFFFFSGPVLSFLGP